MSGVEEEWQVEKILQRGKNNNATFYRVKWKGYPLEESTWEPITNLTNCHQLIIDFERELRERSHARRNRRDPARRINFSKVFPTPSTSQQHTPKMEISPASEELTPITDKPHETTSNPQERQLQTCDRTKKRTVRPSDHSLEVVIDESDYEVEEEECKKRSADHLQKAVEAPPTKKVKEDMMDGSLAQHNISSHHPESSVQKAIEVNQPSRKASLKEEVHVSSQDPLPSKQHSFTYNQKDSSKGTSSQREKGSNGSLKITQSLKPQAQKQSANILLPDQNSKLSSQYRCLQRYQECDRHYEQFLRLALSNLVRRAQGKPRVKWGIAMMDLSSKQALLSELYPIKQLQCESPLDSVEVLLKVEYGWMAVGKSGEQHVMMDVNFIKQQHWDTLLEHLGKQKP